MVEKQRKNFCQALLSVKDQMSRISVCMGTYNGEKYIYQQLLSILPQLNSDDEIIISDDGSTDGTLAIVTRLSDGRIQIGTNKGQKGPLGNFEQAINRATGDLIFLADQDDIWLPDKVNVLRSLLQNNDLVLSDCQVVTETGKLIYESFFEHRRSRPGFWRNLYKNSYVGCCMAFRREVLTYALPFPPQVHMHDWWLGLLVEVKGRVCFYPKPLIHYVRHGGNASPTGEGGYGIGVRLLNRFYLLWHVAKRLAT